jgi:hypothetical protein
MLRCFSLTSIVDFPTVIKNYCSFVPDHIFIDNIANCRVVTEVIKEAKSMHYNKQILETENKIQVDWKTLKKEMGKFCS